MPVPNIDVALGMLVPVPGFATPDILNNASFETDWNGLTNSAPPALPSPSGVDGNGMSVNRSQDVAYKGAWSAKVTFGNNGTNDSSVSMVYVFPSARQTVFARLYFYYTAIPNTSHHKWWRFQQPSFNGPMGGTFLSSTQNGGAVYWFEPDGGGGAGDNDIGTGPIALNTWYSLEIEYDRTTWNTAHGVRVRFWFNGVQIVGSNSGAPNYAASGGSTTYWGDDNGTPANGPWLYTGAPGTNLNIGAMDWDDTFNGSLSGGGNTNTGSIYYDWVAVSSQRIGP